MPPARRRFQTVARRSLRAKNVSNVLQNVGTTQHLEMLCPLEFPHIDVIPADSPALTQFEAAVIDSAIAVPHHDIRLLVKPVGVPLGFSVNKSFRCWNVLAIEAVNFDAGGQLVRLKLLN